MTPIPDLLGISSGSWPNAAPEDSLESALELGFGLFEVEADRAFDAERVFARAAGAHARIVSVSLGQTFDRARAVRFLFGPDVPPGDRPTFATVAGAIAAAKVLRTRVVVLGGIEVNLADRETASKILATAIAEGTDPSDRRRRIEAVVTEREKRRDQAIEELCRYLHGLLTREPGLTLALAPSVHPLSLIGPKEAEWALESLAKKNVRYWHDVGAAALRAHWGLEPKDAWANVIDRWMIGTYVSDVVGFEAGHPPGYGQLPLREILASLPSERPRVLKLRGPLHRLALVGALETLG